MEKDLANTLAVEISSLVSIDTHERDPMRLLLCQKMLNIFI